MADAGERSSVTGLGMKRSGSAVKFADMDPAATDAPNSSGVAGSGGAATAATAVASKPKLRYGKLLASLGGGSGGGGSSPPSSSSSAQQDTRRVFNPSAAPAKPAMKPRARGGAGEAAPLYPEVDEDAVGAAVAAAPTAAPPLVMPNPATGLLPSQYQTPGGAALASALGVPDGVAIPPPCPPALPNMCTTTTTTTSGNSGPLLGGACPQVPPSIPEGPVSNPLAVPDLPHMAPPALAATAAGGAAATAAAAAAAARPAPADGRDLSAAMPASASADGTVQLSTPGYNSSGSKLPELAAAAADVVAANDTAAKQQQQRDQAPKVVHLGAAAPLGGAGGWQALPGGGSDDGLHTAANGKDIEAAANLDGLGGPDSPMAAGGYAAAAAGGAGGAYHDDDASSGIIVPPGSQDPLPPFWSQLTGRALFVGLLVGCAFLLLTMRLSLATGLAPNLQVVIAGACWGVLRLYTYLLGRDMGCIPGLTAQEVSVAAAAALAVASTAAAGGFGSVLLALQGPAAQRVGASVPGNLPSLVWSLAYGKLVGWLVMVALSGAMLMLAFRKPLFGSPVMTFATGAATGQLLTTLHTPSMSYHGHKQMNRFTQWSTISFLFSGYMWVFNNPACNGFARFPTLGLQALKYTWNFDFQLSLCGLGIIAPLSVAWSLVVGAVVSWGLLWPILSSQEGNWFPAGLKPYDPRGVYAYYLVTAAALLLADGAYHAVRGVVTAVRDWRHPDNSEAAAAAATAAAAQEAGRGGGGPSGLHHTHNNAANGVNDSDNKDMEAPGPGLRRRGGGKSKRKFSRQAWKREALRILDSDTLSDASSLQFSLAAMERALRQHIFMSDGMWSWVGICGFVVCSAVAVAGLPALFDVGSAAPVGGSTADARGLQFYYLLVAAPLAALAAFANVRGAGAVDINLADAWAKLGILAFAAWAGSGNAGSAGAGLLCGGLLLGAATSALNAMYAFRAGYMTMTSPTAIFVAFMIGLGAGCLVAPAAWLLFDGAAAAAGVPGAAGLLLPHDSFYASSLVEVFRTTAAVATGGPGALPHAVPWLGLAAFVVGCSLNIVREVVPAYMKGLVPLPAALGVVFLSGANVAVDVVVGAAARVFWRLRYPRSAEAYNLAVGCALIAGEGLWGLGKALLGAFGVQPPICMTFTPAPAQ